MQTELQRLADAVRTDIADLLDLQLSPLGLAAIDVLSPMAGETILDVGCGTGETVRQIAEMVGTKGSVYGVDIGASSLMLARARTTHLPHVSFLNEDAATLSLPDESLDGVYSRFGVMFFEDSILAFSNLRRMLRRDGRLSFVCWRSLAENELDRLPLEAADLGAQVDETPFRFGCPEDITHILRSTGFCSIVIRKVDMPVSSGDVDAMMEVLMKVGALGKILREAPALFAQAEPRVRAALLERQCHAKVELCAATWVVTAVAASDIKSGNAPRSSSQR